MRKSTQKSAPPPAKQAVLRIAPPRSAVAAAEPEDDPHFVTALARGVQILRCFNASQRELGTTEIAALTGLPQPTTWRLCHTLVELDLLATTTRDKLRIAAGVLGLGQSALAGSTAVEAIRQEMQHLADATRTAVSFSVHDQGEMRILARVHSNGTLLFNLSTGSILPMAASASGWAVLGTLPEPEGSKLRERLAQQQGPAWPAAWKAASAAISLLPAQGYVVSRGAIHPDMLGIAVPIVAGEAIYTMSAGGPIKDMGDIEVHRVVAPRLIKLARTAAAALQGELLSPSSNTRKRL